MKAFVKVEYTDKLGRFCIALFTRKGASQQDIINKVYGDFKVLSEVTDIELPHSTSTSVEPSYPEYCYGELHGRDRLTGFIRLLVETDNGIGEVEYRLNVDRKTGSGSFFETDWKYWG